MKKARRVTIYGQLAPDRDEFEWLYGELRKVLLQRFSFMDRTPMLTAMLSALYDVRYTNLMLKLIWRKDEKKYGKI